MDESGVRVVEYIYDAWGKLISTTGTLATTLGADNPFRYRGYYYDTETGLYYLTTRYYDPEVCRFISADVYMSTGQGVLGGNMWAYCLNNPVNMIDSTGTLPLSLHDYYIIHKMVQYHMLADLGVGSYMEVYVVAQNGTIDGRDITGRKGLLDVYDAQTGSYYEVKSEGAAERKSTKRQMARYDHSRVASPQRYKSRNANSSLKRGTQAVSGSFTYGIYDVSYKLTEPGLVVYSCEINKSRVMNAIGVGVSLVGIVGLAATGGWVWAPFAVAGAGFAY